MKKLKFILYTYLSLLLAAGYCPTASAQTQKQKTHTVTGRVTDPAGAPMVGVSIIIKNQPGLGTSTDIDGRYKINSPSANEIIQALFLGYKTPDIPINNRTSIDIQMEEEANQMDEVVVTAAGVQRKASVVGAVTNIKMADLKSPTANFTNALAGNVAGIIAVQSSGEPGKNNSEFWIRGISTFGANASALVLVDGIERDFNEINVEDIESFSVLKDASATAIYGQRGANGVILITTKKGEAGKVNVNVKFEYGMTHSAREPKFVDASTYAALANEARMSRYQDPIYDQEDIELIKYNLDPDLYPNVDWYDTMLKDLSTQYRASVSLSGGGNTARYYISGSYANEEGLYRTKALEAYNTNANLNRYNLRINTDVNLTKTTILEAGIAGWVEERNTPGSASDDIWAALSYMTPITVPLRYSNGQLPTYGTDNKTISPYVLVNETGYRRLWKAKVESNIGLKQDLSFITPGLLFRARFSYDTYNEHLIGRYKMPDLYKAERVRDMNGNLITSRIIDSKALYQESTNRGTRRSYFESTLNWDRSFDKHRLGALVFFYAQSYMETEIGSDVFKSVPKRNLALSGRVTYGYDDRYMLEFNFGYTGSENFERKERFGFFPAIGAGWAISNEKFIKQHAPWINLLKVRYSYGQVGNDRITSDVGAVDGNNIRFPYITSIQEYNNAYHFGNMGANLVPGLTISSMGASHLTWEVAKKHNLGLDLRLWDRFELTADFFRDTRSDIFMRRGYMPATIGLNNGGQRPWGNVGSMQSQGVDGNFAYTQHIGKEFMLTLRGNFTYAYTKVLGYDEAANARYYRMTKGYKWLQNRGLVALGLFHDYDEIANSPTQYGQELHPGDIKYKDIDGNGFIDDDDIVPIGNTRTPEIAYGFGLSAQWKNFDFSILFQGSGKADIILEGWNVFPFSSGETGNFLHAVVEDRWISREISGTAATERQNASFPRLTYGKNANNEKWSTFWLRKVNYLRLKNLEIGYTLPRAFSRKLRMEKARIYFMGYNLACWSPFKWWDPEQAGGQNGSRNGNVYPIQATYTFGLNVNF